MCICIKTLFYCSLHCKFIVCCKKPCLQSSTLDRSAEGTYRHPASGLSTSQSVGWMVESWLNLVLVTKLTPPKHARTHTHTHTLMD